VNDKLQICRAYGAEICWIKNFTMRRINFAMRNGFNFLFILAIIGLIGCGFVPEKTSLTDPRVIPMIQAAATFDRATYGFTPIPTNGFVYLEGHSRAGYDAMLHFNGDTSRTIAFQKIPTGYKWIEEQEIFTGPNLYTNVDGIFHEEICLTYGIRSVSGYSTNKLHVEYWGDDSRLASNRYDLTLSQIKPILAEWHEKQQKP
jgi:hypothetical protein